MKILNSEIIFDLGLQDGGKGNKYLSNICKRYMEKYVPRDTGILRDTAKVGNDNVRYKQIYASYVYKGISKTGKSLNYKTPGTGSYWDKKMMSAEGNDVVKEFQKWLDRS